MSYVLSTEPDEPHSKLAIPSVFWCAFQAIQSPGDEISFVQLLLLWLGWNLARYMSE